MILCWLKIIWYKINKRLNHAETGGAPHTRAGATRGALPPFPFDEARCASCDQLTADCTCTPGENSTDFSVGLDPAAGDEGLVLYSRIPGAPQDSIGSRKLRELIDLGLVSLPLDGDLYRIRMEQLYEDHRVREIMEMESGRGCPCGGRHYPEDDACRWCRCHDPRNVHHTAEARGIMQMIKPQKLMDVRPSAEIVLCGACHHPQHTAGDRRCAFLVPPGLALCPCDWTGILPEAEECTHWKFPGAVCRHDAPEIIDTDEATDAAWDSFLGLPPDHEDGHS